MTTKPPASTPDRPHDHPNPDASIDVLRWPDVARVPRASVRAAVARQLFRHAADRLPIRVEEPDGRSYGGGGNEAPLFRLHRPAAFFHRLGASGTIGFGEAFMAGDWSSDDLAGVLTAFAANMRELVPAALQRLRHAVLRKQPAHEDNTVEGARQNIHRHYDLSNDLFKAFLDRSMTYSSALFAGDPGHASEDLATAQHRKIDRLLDATQVGPGVRLLEIGTGWGELSLRAGRRGADVTSLTISTEQAELARERIATEGLSDRVRVELLDYRQVQGKFDAVVSVEMIEAVGNNHLHEYFGTVDRVLEPAGRFGLQAITQVDAAVRATDQTYTWIRKYIFPGGALASVELLGRVVREHTSLRVTDHYQFGLHYAETLRRWRERFEAAGAEVARLGFDETFRRMWSLYLAYSEAGFRSGYLDVGQFTISKPA
ncbi:MAG: class I SAM-dependent methyltransferase [Actinobacteria bacterium]|nr:class I SAM-dependent methyltransferase [Actinomycetota bacterium]